MSSSEDDLSEEEPTDNYESDQEWDLDLKSWKEVVGQHRRRDPPCSARTIGWEHPKAGEIGSLKEIMVGYAGAVEEAPEWEELEMNVGICASVTVIGRDIVKAVLAKRGKTRCEV